MGSFLLTRGIDKLFGTTPHLFKFHFLLATRVLENKFSFPLYTYMLWTKNLSKKIYHGQTYVLRLFFSYFNKIEKLFVTNLRKRKILQK